MQRWAVQRAAVLQNSRGELRGKRRYVWHGSFALRENARLWYTGHILQNEAGGGKG